MLALSKHLEQQHEIEVCQQQLSFKTFDEFTRWKVTEEDKCNSYYVQQTAPKVYGTTKHLYLYCNRFGSTRFRGKGERHIKVQGSCKAGKTCIANMKIKEDVTGKVIVDYCSTHTGHSIQLCHLPIPDSIKHTISAKLHQGVSVDKILDDIRNDLITKKSIGREHLIQRQDILNLQKEINIHGIRKHANDLASTCAWVEDLKKQEYNPVLLFKPQGEEQNDAMNDIGCDDFILAIQTEFQRDAMLQYGNKAILMDATHGTTQYDFLLISLLVIDDHGEGIPAAWAITNREDTAILVQFLKAVHSQVGDIETAAFMSDCAEQYFNAWQGTFTTTEKTKKLLCTWHVDRAWRKSLNTHVSNTQQQIEIYHQLRVMLEERDQSEFTVRLQQLMSFLNENQKEFYEYFRTQYAVKTNEWATCFRVGTIVNTNMFVESFHRLLKVVYFNSRQNRRVDNLLHTLLRIARNLVYQQLRKVEVGKLTHRRCEINKRHKAAQDFNITSNVRLHKEKNDTWTIESLTNKGKQYTIEKLNVQCSCALKCFECGICIHTYSCTCLDATLHCTICKHVHLLSMSDASTDNSTESQADNDKEFSGKGEHTINTQVESSVDFSTHAYFTDVLNRDGPIQNTIASAFQEVTQLNQEVLALAKECHDDSDINTLKTVQTHLKSARSVMLAAKRHRPLELGCLQPSAKKMAPNALHTKQDRFFSTKKKAGPSRSRIAKPSNNQLQNTKMQMTNTDIQVCGICWKQDDKGKDTEIKWLQCDLCSLWIHATCTKGFRSNTDGKYTCSNCI